ncbi:hypothetical protein [Devosia sp. A369]
MADIGLRARVEASMCISYGSQYPDGREEARISREDWESLLATLRLTLNGPGCVLTPVVRQAIQETIGEH